jgi:hypothetical protein
MLKAFDAPSREECAAQRPQSNTPLAALTLLNDPTFAEASRAFAARILMETSGQSDELRLDRAMRLATSRLPDVDEVRILQQLIQASSQYYGNHPEEAQKALEVGLAPRPDIPDVVELATWTTIARAILNLDETITRN